MKRLKSIWCKIAGHDWDELSMAYCGELHCLRCAKQIIPPMDEERTLVWWVWFIKTNVKWKLNCAKRWFICTRLNCKTDDIPF